MWNIFSVLLLKNVYIYDNYVVSTLDMFRPLFLPLSGIDYTVTFSSLSYSIRGGTTE
jgi:hypothetical protein